MFLKHGSAVALMQPTNIDQWNSFKTASLKEELREVVASIDNDCLYLHGTILASVDLEPDHEYYIKKDSEDFINDNGDAFPRDEVLKRYQTFKTHSRTYAEHKQGPEHAKGKCVDAVIRDLGNTILVDVLFTVDKTHFDLVRNVEKKIVTHLSMGCQTEFTKCSICGHLAHNEDEYCDHIKNSKRQMIQASDGKMRKAAELCYNNTWIDISLVMNPAFGGAAIRKILSSDTVGKQVLASILSKHINEEHNFTYEQAITKVASLADSYLNNIPNDVKVELMQHPITNDVSNTIDLPLDVKNELMQHPINNDISNTIYPPQGYEDIPWKNPHDVKDDFDKDNPGNESEVEGPINNLENCSEQAIQDKIKQWECIKCSNKTASITNEIPIAKCLKCGYIHEFDEPLQFHASIITTKKINKEAVNQIIKNLYEYSDVQQLKNAQQQLDEQNIDSQLLKQAIEKYSDIDFSERLIQAQLLQIEKLAFNEDSVKTGISLYIEKIHDKWDRRDISELIYEMFPYEATVILDEVRKIHFR